MYGLLLFVSIAWNINNLYQKAEKVRIGQWFHGVRLSTLDSEKVRMIQTVSMRKFFQLLVGIFDD